MTQVNISKQLASDLVDVIDNRIRFLSENIRRNPGPIKEKLERLREFFKIIDVISCENDV